MPSAITLRRGDALQLDQRVNSFREAFPAFGHTDCIPTTTDIVAAKRLSSTLILVRVLTPGLEALDGLAFDEYVLRDPAGYSDVAGGWFLYQRRAVALGRVWRWFVGAEDQGKHANADWALRIGPYAATYVSGGEGPDYAFTGFGHGRLTNVPANNQIILDGAGANRQSTANWPVGTVIKGSKLSVSANYKLKYYTAVNPTIGGTEAVNLDYALYFGVSPGGPTHGMVRVGTFNAIVAGVGIQDSYTGMLPVSEFDVDRFKPNGFDAIPIIHDGNQKPTTYPNPWSSGTSTLHQAYVAADPRLVETLDISDIGKPLRRTAGGADIAAWALNNSARYFFRDLARTSPPLFPKYYIFSHSSEEAEPRTAWELSTADTWNWFNVLESRYHADGVVP